MKVWDIATLSSSARHVGIFNAHDGLPGNLPDMAPSEGAFRTLVKVDDNRLALAGKHGVFFWDKVSENPLNTSDYPLTCAAYVDNRREFLVPSKCDLRVYD